MLDRYFFVNERDIEKVEYVRKGSSLKIDIQKAFDPEVTGTKCGIMGIMTVPPESERMVPHSHQEYEEIEYVIEGEGLGYLGPSDGELREVPVRAGDFFYFPAGYVHAYHNTGKEPLRVLFAYFPEAFKGAPMSEISSRLTNVPLR